HLGSTVLVTDSDGNAFETQQYYAYGRPRGGGALPTDFTYTGQKVDGTGLMYYRARYYDPVIGQFVSPDTIVPDATSVLDYNRFAYARANPLKYNDPSGHCSADGSVEDGYQDECWKYVDDIINTWDDTDYWNKRWASKENFLTYVAPTAHNDAEYMMGELNQYWGSDAFKSWKAEQPVPALTSAQLARQADPVCAGGKICQKMVQGAEKVQQKCAEIDCVAIGNDIVGVVATGAVAVGCIPAVAACATVTATYGTVAMGSTAFGVLWTGSSWLEGDASNTDLTVNLLTAGGGFVTGGLAPAARDLQVIYSVSQLTYDITPKE
ncbi:MAG: RHS repeat-associated core domain-containing protein, partial [Caldilineaceae bacterium]|nr:RHS repeat-associated core domain-containing protein [Caldilineaceae bacterium]